MKRAPPSNLDRVRIHPRKRYSFGIGCEVEDAKPISHDAGPMLWTDRTQGLHRVNARIEGSETFVDFTCFLVQRPCSFLASFTDPLL